MGRSLSREMKLGLGVRRMRYEISYIADVDLARAVLVALVRKTRFRVGYVTPRNRKRTVGVTLTKVRKGEVVVIVIQGTAPLEMKVGA